jgi:acyl-CoA thioester hydrolase
MARSPEVPVPLEAQVVVDVPFQDSDPMGVTWHGNYFRYLEAARALLLANIGYGYRDMIASGYLWPIVEAQIKYVKPTVFGQRLTVTATLVEYENRLKIGYTVVDHDSGECVTKAHTTQVAVARDSGEMCFCSPQVFLDKVRACVAAA